MILYHGSEFIIKKPEYGRGKTYNDYGRGFYCTEHIELAKEWACTRKKSGFVNEYKINMEGLRILDLSEKEYHILHWIALLLKYRSFELSAPVAAAGKEYLLDNYLIPAEEYDVIRGYRADDSYFSFAKAFLNNTISIEQLKSAMQLGKLGEQIVLKSRAAFERIMFVSWDTADYVVYYPRRWKRDERARTEYRCLRQKFDTSGIYLVDLMRSGRTYEESCI